MGVSGCSQGLHDEHWQEVAQSTCHSWGGAVGSGICELLGDVVPEPVVICVGPQVVTSSRQVP